jgi:hypothetical protein
MMLIMPGHARMDGWRLLIADWHSATAPQVRVQDEAGGAVAATLRWQALALPPGVARPLGVLDVGGLAPGRRYSIAFPDGAVHKDTFILQTLPDRLPAQGTTIMLASCYYECRDAGELRAAVADLPAFLRPSFKLLVGDQIYTDVPGFSAFSEADEAAEDYAERYAKYWNSDKYHLFLADSPNFFTCDDHEFWNNYPDFAPFVPRSWSASWRRAYGRAANQLYDLYQAAANPGSQRWYQIEGLSPLSFFVADTRSQRQPYSDTATLIPTAQLTALKTWASGLQGPGILVIGQPLFADAGGFLDRTLADFPSQYREIWHAVEEAPHSIMVLSGDIHVGRFARTLPPAGVAGRREVYELIASPTALVNPGRYDEPEAPRRIDRHGRRRSADQVDVETRFASQEDLFGLIHFRPAGDRILATVRLWSIEHRREAQSALDPARACVEEIVLR